MVVDMLWKSNISLLERKFKMAKGSVTLNEATDLVINLEHQVANAKDWLNRKKDLEKQREDIENEIAKCDKGILSPIPNARLGGKRIVPLKKTSKTKTSEMTLDVALTKAMTPGVEMSRQDVANKLDDIGYNTKIKKQKDWLAVIGRKLTEHPQTKKVKRGVYMFEPNGDYKPKKRGRPRKK